MRDEERTVSDGLTPSAIRTRVREVIRGLAPNPVEQVEPGNRLEEDLLFDSLALLELAVQLEREFELPGFDEDLVEAQLQTVGDVEKVIVELIGTRG